MTTLQPMADDKDAANTKPAEARKPDPHHVPTDAELGVPDEHVMSGMDYAEHERTYAGFLRMTKWGVIVVCVVLVLMALFLT